MALNALPRSSFRNLKIQSRLSHRPYHSTTHPAPPSPFPPIESLILRAATPHIPSSGFTHTTLSQGARDAGYLDASTNLFPAGPFALVHWHLYQQRTRLKDVATENAAVGADGAAGAEGQRSVRERVRHLTWERLMGNQDVVKRWQEALALIALPSNIRTSVHELSLLSDEILYLSGDTSVDTSWYTKRASLSAIYAASELFMTTDRSIEFRDTREFLERRLRDQAVVGSAMGSVGQWVGFTAAAGVNVLRSKGVRI